MNPSHEDVLIALEKLLISFGITEEVVTIINDLKEESNTIIDLPNGESIIKFFKELNEIDGLKSFEAELENAAYVEFSDADKNIFA